MIESIQVDQLGVPVRAFLSSRRPPRAPRTVAEKRQATARQMTCPAAGCAGRLLITPTGCLVCEHCCGRLLGPGDVGIRLSIASLREAWPDRVIEHSEARKKFDRE
jgi:hypothetical protein